MFIFNLNIRAENENKLATLIYRDLLYSFSLLVQLHLFYDK